ncbi:MAG: hypothetical protein K8M05_31870, partial [Deltaproteobacteria bacterium]|nr:hypothetical protein [Kofleriaceae bacterium]
HGGPPARPRHDQHADAERREHPRDRDTPADHHAYDHTEEYEHRRHRRGGEDDDGNGNETPNPDDRPDHDEVPADDLQARRVAYREQLRAQDAEDPSYVEANQGTVTRQDVYHALSRLGPSYPRDFKALMVGHSFGEQGGRNVVHYNYMGVELWRFTRPANDKRKFTRALRSDIITPAEYRANPDYFWDWKDSGKGTIQQQLAKGATRIYCLYPGPRAVFSSVDDASRSFWHTIVGWRLNACRSSANPAHQAIAQGALAGDVEAYIQLVELNDATIKVRPYNGNKEYPSIVRPHLRHALADASLND